jgi:hypothetical protein
MQAAHGKTVCAVWAADGGQRFICASSDPDNPSRQQSSQLVKNLYYIHEPVLPGYLRMGDSTRPLKLLQLVLPAPANAVDAGGVDPQDVSRVGFGNADR